MLRKNILVLCFIALAAASQAAAQGTTSRLLGVVTDQTGGVVPGATITLTNEATGVSFSTVSTGAGTYTFEAIQVGTYTVTVELQGFKKFVARGNPVNISEPSTVNVRLEPGGVEQQVEVTAAAPVVQTSTSGNIGTTFEQKTIESLPIIGGRGRNVLDLVLTQPGVVSGANTGGGVHVNGARDRSWNYTLDGIDNNESSAGGSSFAPLRTNPDSIAEFRVLTGNVTAELGRNSGGQVNMVTRSGTNKFSGTAYYFDRRPKYNANEWENNVQNVPKSNFTQHIPGFSLGGPIKKNSTFFFVNSQWLRLDRTLTITRSVYTAQARQGIWRYVLSGRNQMAGTSGASVDPSGNPIVPFGTYNIPANDPQHLGLDPAIQALIARTPLPNDFVNIATERDGLNIAGYTWQSPERERQNDWVAKVDHVFGSHHTAFVRVAKGYQNTYCDNGNGGLAPFPGVTCLVDTTRDPYNVAGNWRWNPAGSMVNELVAGVNHFTFDFITPEADPTKLSYSLQVAPPEDHEVGNLRTIDTYQFVDNLSYVRGAHSFKLGTNMRFQRHTDERGSVAGLNVSPLVDFSTGVNTVDPGPFGIPAANINTTFDRPALQTGINTLLGRVGNISQAFVQRGDSYAPGGTTFLFKAWFPELDFYAQDTWKPQPNLTIDAGVRWEVKNHPTNPDGLIRVPNQRVAVDASPSTTLNWVTGNLYKNDVNNFGPSVGVAWDPLGDGKSVVRGNYRIAYDRINTFLLSSAIFQSIPGITTGVVNTAFGQASGRLRDGLPPLAPTAKPGDLLQPATSSNSIRVVDPEFQSPLTHGWAISYQRQVWGKTMLEVAYVGRRGEHLFGAYNVNQAEYRNNGFLDAFIAAKNGGESALLDRLLGPDSRLRSGESGAAMVRRLFQSNLDLNSVASLAASLGQRIQNGKSLAELSGLGPNFFFPYPQFLSSTGVIVIDSNDYSRYHALETKLERRYGNGVSYFVGYTLSRSKDTRSYDPAFTVVSTANNQSASSTPFNVHDRSLNFAPSDFDRTHVFQGQFVWELPFGRGRRFASGASPVVDGLVSGWQLASQVVIESGRPMTVYAGSNTFTNVVQTPANCTGCSRTLGSVHEEGGIVFYFSPEERGKFSNPAPGQYSNVGRNYFRGPMFSNLNVTASKRTRIHGTQSLEFRVDATNVLNHASFGFPTLTTTSTTFGRIYNTVASSSRQIQIGVKYLF